jgi:hypothetical protein
MHSQVVNGKGTTKIQTVTIKNKKGTKEVVVRDMKGKTLRKTRKSLTPSNIRNIRNGNFIPGLFRDCTPKQA